MDIRISAWSKIWDYRATDIRLKDILVNPGQEDLSVVKVSEIAGIGSEKHAPPLTTEGEVRNALRALHIARRMVFPADMSTEVLLSYLDSSKYLYIFFAQHDNLRTNNSAKADILVSFCESILRKNAERYKSNRPFLTFDEINQFPAAAITRYKGTHPNLNVKRDRSTSGQNRQPSYQPQNKRPSTSSNRDRSQSSDKPRHPNYNPHGPKGQRWESTPESIANLKKRLCIKFNTKGDQADGSNCSNRRSGQGCVTRDNKTYVHRCNFPYDGPNQDGSYCNQNHTRFNHK